MPHIKLYWSAGLKNGRKNFGDWLSPILCEVVSGRKVEYAKLSKCDMVAVGSILHRLKNNFWTHRVHVWGSGLIEQRAPFRSPHTFNAVRGKLTASALKNHTVTVLGDPGLLSDLLLPSGRRDKLYRVGVIPHYNDQKSPVVEEFLKQTGVTFIDIFSETVDFLEQVARCEFIVSSSLHGLIVADALEIPNAWIKLSNLVRGNDFKFADYYSVFDMENVTPMPFGKDTSPADVEAWCCGYNRQGLPQIKSDLYNAFPFLG